MKLKATDEKGRIKDSVSRNVVTKIIEISYTLKKQNKSKYQLL